MAHTEVLLANSHKQLLAEHGALVGLLARKIVQDTFKHEEGYAQAAFLSGMLHDIGKADSQFQRFLSSAECSQPNEEDGTHILEGKKTKGFSFNEYPRHNEVSWALLTAWVDDRQLRNVFLSGRPALWECVKYAVFWHHAKPIRTDVDVFNTNHAILAKVSGNVSQNTLMDLISATFSAAGVSCENYILSEPDERLDAVPAFKESYTPTKQPQVEKALQVEALRSAVRSAVVYADRVVSALSCQEVTQWLATYKALGGLPNYREHAAVIADDTKAVKAQIAKMLMRYEINYPGSLRNKQQADAAKSLAKRSVSILQGPAGCGKTKIMLEYLSINTSDDRTFIFVPRTAIGQGLFDELTQEYDVTASIELLTGDVKLQSRDGCIENTAPGSELTSSIVITTIDQLCSIALSHHRIDFLMEVLNSTIIVDEFHELFDLSGIVLLFLEIMALRFKVSQRKTLLVSATPNPFFLNEISKLDTSSGAPLKSCVVKVPSFNEKPFHLALESYDPKGTHPFERVMKPGNILVANTATRAQITACRAVEAGIPTLCFHSKFTPRDKKKILYEVLQYFGKESDSSQRLLCAGPIVQASLNISTQVIHIEAIHAENFFQRLGRANRFGYFDYAIMIMYAQKLRGLEGQVDGPMLASLNQKYRTQAWVDFFINSGLKGVSNLQDLYEQYEIFHAQAATKEAYKKDFDAVLLQSLKDFDAKNFDPIQLPKPKAIKTNNKRLAVNSLRGNSYYVLPIYRKELHGVITESWLYGEDSAEDERLTDGLERWQHLSDNDKSSAIQYMESKNIQLAKWKSTLPSALLDRFKRKGAIKRLGQWLALARDASMPVVLKFQGNNNSFEYEQVYLEKENTLVGLISLKNLKF